MLSLGPYRLVRTIGRGGSSEVWKAEGPQGGVALKVLTAERSRQSRYVRAFRNEVRAAASLDHPRILAVLDHGQVDRKTEWDSHGQLIEGSPWLAMEHAPGGTLRKRLGRLRWSSCRALVLDLLAGLAHAQSRGVIHRDLKPGNVLGLGGPRGFALADFGLAQILGPDEPLGDTRVVGTPGYMAPEQFEGRWRDFGPWTDLYALGCLVWALVCGEAPFGTRGAHLARAHLTWPAPPLRQRVSVPEELEAWVHRLMEKDPRQRFPCAADAAWAFEQLGEASLPALSKEGQGVEQDEGPTTAMEPDEAEAPVQPAPLLPRPPAWVPPMPKAWQQEGAPPRPRDVGLGLFGLRRMPTVGREPLRDALWAALGEVRSQRRSKALLLIGAGGVGASELARWLGERAQELGAAETLRVLHSPSAGRSEGLVPAVARQLGCQGLSRPEVRARLRLWLGPGELGLALERLVDLLAPSQGRGLQPGDPGERYDRLRTWLAEACRERPLVLWLDGAPWGGDTLGFVLDLLDGQDQLPVLALVTGDPTELEGRSVERRLLDRILGRPSARRLEVPALGMAERMQLLRSGLGLAAAPAEAIASMSAGNPLYALQIVGDWVGGGLLRPGPQGLELFSGRVPTLPSSLDALWRQRLARLFAGRLTDDSVALWLASLLGRHVDSMEWGAACRECRVRPSPGLLDDLVEAGLALEEEEGWAFAHALLQGVLRQQVVEAGRWAELHGACAKALLGLESSEDDERVGRHLLEAGDHEAAVRRLGLALGRCAERGEMVRAEVVLDLRELALERLAPVAADPRWGEGLRMRADLARMDGRLQEAREHATALLRAARLHDWSALQAQALRQAGRLAYMGGDAEGAVELLEQAVQQARGADEPVLLGRCHELLGRVLTDLGQKGRALQSYALAAAALEGSSEPALRAEALYMRAFAATLGDDFDLAFTYASEAQELLGSAVASMLLTDVLVLLAEIERFRGNLLRAEHLYRRCVARHQASGWREGVHIARLNLALVALAREDWGRAAEEAARLREQLEGEGSRMLQCIADAVLLAARAGLRRWDGWTRDLERIRAEVAQTGLVDRDLAAALELAARYARSGGQDASTVATLAARQWRAQGREERARELAEDLGLPGLLGDEHSPNR